MAAPGSGPAEDEARQHRRGGERDQHPVMLRGDSGERRPCVRVVVRRGRPVRGVVLVRRRGGVDLGHRRRVRGRRIRGPRVHVRRGRVRVPQLAPSPSCPAPPR